MCIKEPHILGLSIPSGKMYKINYSNTDKLCAIWCYRVCHLAGEMIKHLKTQKNDREAAKKSKESGDQSKVYIMTKHN